MAATCESSRVLPARFAVLVKPGEMMNRWPLIQIALGGDWCAWRRAGVHGKAVVGTGHEVRSREPTSPIRGCSMAELRLVIDLKFKKDCQQASSRRTRQLCTCSGTSSSSMERLTMLGGSWSPRSHFEYVLVLGATQPFGHGLLTQQGNTIKGVGRPASN